MAAVIQFTDGTTTIDLTDTSSGYALLKDGWSPKVAKRQRSKMGGRSPYEDVQEVIQIKVKGTSVTNCLSRLDDLSNLFDQATAWGQGENVTAVELQYQHEGSSTTVDAVIYDAEVIPPVDFAWMGAQDTVLYPVTLRFMRRGLWLGSTETETSSSSTGNPAIVTSTSFSDTADIPWPYDLTVRFTVGGAVSIDTTHEMYFLCSDQADKLYLAEAESQTLSSNVVSASVSGSSAGSVANCKPITNLAERTITDTTLGFDTTIKKAMFWAVVQNLSNSTTDWSVSLRVYGGSGGYAVGHQESRTTVIEADSGDDTVIVPFGPFSLDRTINMIRLVAVPSAVGVDGTDNLYVDYIAGIGLDDSASIIHLPVFDGALVDDTDFNFEHRLDSDLNPTAYATYVNDASLYHYWSYEGALPLVASGNGISCLVFGCRPVANTWVIEDTSTNELDFSIQDATRTKSYLSPP